MFPYVCEECRGGYNRCGQGHEDCEGGQCCWEDRCIVQVVDTYNDNFKSLPEWKQFKGEVLNGVYNGYGIVESIEIPIGWTLVPEEFYDFLDCWEVDTSKVFMVKIWCASCFRQGMAWKKEELAEDEND